MSVFLHKYVYVHVCCVFSFKPNSPFPEMRSYPGITSQIFHLHPITTKTHTMLILQLDHFSRKCVWLVTVKPEPLLLCTYQTTPSIAACVSVCVCVCKEEEGKVHRNVGLGWVEWDVGGKRGVSMWVCMWAPERLKMYVSALMKVCFPTVFTPLGPTAFPTVKTQVMKMAED